MIEACKLKNCKDIDNCHISFLTDSVSVSYQRMDFSKISDNFSVIDHVCLSSRMEVSLTTVWIIIYFISHSDFLKELFTNALHIKEITISIHTKSKMHTFIRKFCKWKRLRTIYITKLIETDIFISSVIICSKRTEHTVQSSCSHNTVIFSQRVADNNSLTKLAVSRKS